MRKEEEMEGSGRHSPPRSHFKVRFLYFSPFEGNFQNFIYLSLPVK